MEYSESLDIFLKIWPILQAILAGLLGWVCWSLHKNYVPRKEHEQAKEELLLRIETMEKRLEHSATVEDFHRLEVQITEVKGDIRASRQEIKSINELLKIMQRGVDMLTRHHIEGDGA
ncbi:MAG: DUF2730 domain-containing protein [Desulfarculales bacterium]|nr:DUF2730 domain-containing protein [Desulfarculales bacterium]